MDNKATTGSNTEKGISNEYKFNYPWAVVMKGLWNKYPNTSLPFVKFSKVIDLKVLDENTMIIRKLVYSKQLVMVWAYTVEEVRLDFSKKICEMKTTILKKSKMVPNMPGFEHIIYKEDDQDSGKTVYQKFLRETNSCVMKYVEKVNSSFEKGCRVVEEKCREFLNSITEDKPLS